MNRERMDHPRLIVVVVLVAAAGVGWLILHTRGPTSFAGGTRVPANGYTLVNLAGSYDLGNGLTAYARIDNLLDRHYQDPIGFLRPGLGVFAGVRMAFDVVPPGR
jgi:outer membrane cobalamin receptor